MNTNRKIKVSTFLYILILGFFVIAPIAFYLFINSYYLKNGTNKTSDLEVFVAEPVANTFNFSFFAENLSLSPNVEKQVLLKVESTNSDSVGASLVTATVKIPTGIEVVTKTLADSSVVVDKSKTKGLLTDTLINLVEYNKEKRELTFIFISDVSSGNKFTFNKGLNNLAQVTLITTANSGNFKLAF
ncbi:hypothetical protein KA001_02765, partial [Patescibacteria group bacterium]|nr:hypothetical protein [Patescibacteria group bacterium]